MDITVPEAAARSGLAAETIRRWIRDGRLPARKVGTQFLIEERDLERMTARPRARRVGKEAAVYITEPAPALDRMLDRIAADPNVLGGKPVVRGTRMSVEHVLECLAGGWTVETLLDQYPTLGEADVRACLAFAAKRVSSERIWPLPV